MAAGRRLVRMVMLATVVAAALIAGTAAAARAATFDPELIISNDNMRAYDCMSADDIQAFLETQPGALATLKTADRDKVITLSKTKDNVNTTPDKGEDPKLASRIIWEACQEWRISPKVMLTMLQKEQSLLTRKPREGSNTLARALGAGCPGHLVFPTTNPVATNRYPGFGNQVWHSARLLASYGESHPYFSSFKPDTQAWIGNPKTTGDWLIKKTVGTKTNYYIDPQNLATYKLYIYNPVVGAKEPFGDLVSQAGRTSGNANFWLIYRRYFGSTTGNPRIRPIYRFESKRNGTYLYTASAGEMYRLSTGANSDRWHYEGAAFSWDTSVTAASTVPVYRFYNKKTKKYSFTTSSAKYKDRRSAKGRKTWEYGGVAFRVARASSSGAVTVYRFENRRTGGWLLTKSEKTVKRLKSTASRKTWRYDGVAFYLPRAATP